MLFVAFLATALIGALEYASRELPHANKGHKLQSQMKSALHKRQDSATAATASSAGLTGLLTETAAQSAYVSTKILSSTSGDMEAFTAASSAYVNPVTSTTNDGAYVPTQSTVASAPSSNYV
jgi:hypothetical protein